jgi:HK97 family phage major capsid protein
MPYNNIVSRTDALPAIPEQVYNQLLQELNEESAALRMFTRVPMSTHQTRMPVLAALPVSYFVAGDTGLKQTTEASWSNRYLNVEELAAIVPIPEAVLDDAAFSLWDTIRPLLRTAIARTLDAAIFFGTNKPSSWPTSLVAGAAAVSNTVTRGTGTAAKGGVAEDFNQLFSKIEADGYDVNGMVAQRTFRVQMRALRDTTGQKLLDVQGDSVNGVQVVYAMPGLWPTGSGAAEIIAGDTTQGLIGVRQDVSFKLLDQAVLTDASGNIQFNLAQMDMLALRVVARFAYQVANVINYQEQTEANRWPFAVMVAP